jgi:N-terminal half of MaoC dehydratase
LTPLDEKRFPGLRDLVGVVGTPLTRHVSSDTVRCFTRSLGVAIELATTPDEARVPGTFFCPDPLVIAAEARLPRPVVLDRTIDGGTEWEFVRPVRLGDQLTLIARIADISQRSTSDGRVMISTIFEVCAWNHHAELVGIARGTSLNYEERSS